MKSILLVKKFLGLVEMTSALCQLQLARMASCKNDFLCTLRLSVSDNFTIETDDEAAQISL